MTQLVKVGGQLAEGIRLQRRVKQVMEQYESAQHRLVVDYHARLKAVLAENEPEAEPTSAPIHPTSDTPASLPA